MKKVRVAIVMGSDSDLSVMKDAEAILKRFNVSYEMKILSAHRAPLDVSDFARNASKNGIQVIIAGAGLAAHLPGVIAAHTELPVIGVPLPSGPLNGQDSLYSIVQMPKGIPVATVGIGNAQNAGLLAIQILASGGASIDGNLKNLLLEYKEELRKENLARNDKIK
ncbi:MAG: 5-(carboxyamino)imidazole ribonucleotide mutase [SAR324 cluster bacterium]|uniref:N5-carboxyaminoimidazole ribonucleotide mutase n=1 Tax=SAR324 cluster bacterium TaxID=2024889 RepID=A0A7X9FPB0_9DELT|nr:5-(carboxyamino)imidazole ribonucleotide mutase [SAR324 cluster bacterium]